MLLAGALAVSAFAQSSTATIRGKVTNDQGTALPGAKVTAVGTASGFVKTSTAGPDGSFQLGGLTPGEYNITVAAQGFQARTQTVSVLVGQNLNVTFAMTPTAVDQRIDHRHRRAADRHADAGGGDQRHHAADREPAAGRPQLPQLRGARARHPAVDRSAAQDDRRRRPAGRADQRLHRRRELQERRAAGRPGRPGLEPRQPVPAERRAGVPRHHPELQRAVREGVERDHHRGHQVGRQRHPAARLFWFYQPKQWVSALPKNFQYLDADHQQGLPAQPARPLDRRTDHQGQAPLLPLLRGGRRARRRRRSTSATRTSPSQFGQYTGIFPSPFKSNLGFGKLSWQPAQNQLVDFSGNYRHEHETRDFGGQTSFQSATDLKNSVYGSTLRHSGTTTGRSTRRRSATRTTPGIRRRSTPTSSGSTSRASSASAATARPRSSTSGASSCATTTTSPSPRRGGDHSLQVGGNFDSLRYNVNKSQTGNPEFNFRNDPANGFTFDQPFEAQFGFGNPQPLDQQPGVRRLRPGHLDGQSAPDGQPRPALGLRDRTSSTPTT